MSTELETRSPEIITQTSLQQITSAEVDMQVATAKRFPRSIKEFKQETKSIALRTPQIAQSCFYVLPRAGKRIEGPSIRLAEIVAGTWGNLRCETRVINVGEKTITAQATAWDMQRNVLVRCETSRRITDKKGKRYSDDMVVTTGNAASSIALRNAIFRVVPLSYVDEIYHECKQVAVGNGGGIDQAKQDWLAHFGRMGIESERVFEMLGKAGVEDIGVDDISTLQGLNTALREGQTTLEEVFPEKLKPGTKTFGFKAKKQNGTPVPEAAEPEEQNRPEPPPEAAPAGEVEPWAKYLEGKKDGA
jgi:hypothetical protein